MLRAAAIVILCIAAVQAGRKHGTLGRNEIHRTVVAVFNQGGVAGEVVFTQERINAPVDIQVNLNGLDQFADAYRWSIHNFPIRRSLLNNYPCQQEEVGGVFYPDDPTGSGNPPSCVGNPEACAAGDLTSKLGRLRNDQTTQIFQDPNLDLFGSQSIVGRSLVIDRQDGLTGAFICANIELNGRPSRRVETLRATFNNGIIQGDVIIRDPSGFDEVTVEADLHRINGVDLDAQGVSWSLNVGPANENCNGIKQVYGSAGYNADAFDCSMEKQRECIIGDLNSKCGSLGFNTEGRARAYCADSQLGTLSADSIKDLMVRITDSNGVDLGCANFTKVRPIRAEAEFRGISTEYGSFILYQDSPDDETHVKAFVTGLRSQAANYALRIFNYNGSEPCNATFLGGMYRVPGRALFTSSSNIMTADACVIGNLDNVLRVNRAESLQTTVPTSIPLFGPFSVIGSAIALVDNMSNVVACSIIKDSCTTCMLERYNSLLGYQDFNNLARS